MQEKRWPVQLFLAGNFLQEVAITPQQTAELEIQNLKNALMYALDCFLVSQKHRSMSKLVTIHNALSFGALREKQFVGRSKSI